MQLALAREFEHAALRREIAVEDRVAAARFERRGSAGTTTCWSAGAGAAASSSSNRLRPVTVGASSSSPPARNSRATVRHAARGGHLHRGILAARHQVGDDRRRLRRGLEVFESPAACWLRLRSPADAAPRSSNQRSHSRCARRCGTRSRVSMSRGRRLRLQVLDREFAAAARDVAPSPDRSRRYRCSRAATDRAPSAPSPSCSR